MQQAQNNIDIHMYKAEYKIRKYTTVQSKSNTFHCVVIIRSCHGTDSAGLLKYNLKYSRCLFAAMVSLLGPVTVLTSCYWHLRAKVQVLNHEFRFLRQVVHSGGPDNAFSSSYEDTHKPQR